MLQAYQPVGKIFGQGAMMETDYQSVFNGSPNEPEAR